MLKFDLTKAEGFEVIHTSGKQRVAHSHPRLERGSK